MESYTARQAGLETVEILQEQGGPYRRSTVRGITVKSHTLGRGLELAQGV